MSRSATVKRVLTLGLAALIGIGAAGFAWVWFAPCSLGGCAPLDDIAGFQAEGSQLLDVRDQPFGTLATVNRRVVSLDSLPEYVPRAFIAVEDQRFYDHGGVDFRRLVGAMLSNVRARGVAEGGSTITQQLARNLFPEWLPYTERSLTRKLKEARVARQIEREFSKEKILELYLNHIYLGNGAYGIDAAAQAYFGKPASELTLAEAATLGGLPKAPSQLDPTENPDGARRRRDLVLSEMAEVGYITDQQKEEASSEPIRLSRAARGADGATPGSYFIEQVRREMEETVGTRLYTSGLRVYTTLDLDAQRAAEEELERQLRAIEGGRFGAYRHPTYARSEEGAPSGQTEYLQGAVILMDAASGEVRALVGGRDFGDSKFNRAIQAQRQPGSAFKPFVYLTALQRHGTPAHPVNDAPVRLTLAGGEVWEPRNYTGTYEGPMTMRTALARSKNSVTVQLAEEAGMGSVIETARSLGITSEIPDVPSTALGSAEVRPIELVQAYAAFANGGDRVQPHFIRRIEDRHGQVVWQADEWRERALDPGAAFVLTSMLQDVVDRGTGAAVRAVGFQGAAAGKTGTTNDAADVWFVGYTPELVAGVWMGLDRRATIVRGASGGTLAAPVWGRLMRRVYAGRPAPAPWSPPSGVITAQVEALTGRVIDEGCPAQGPTYTEYFLNYAPSAGCEPPAQYASSSWYDSIYGDEEWSAELPPIDTSSTLPPGVEWPELEALRRRMQVGAGGAPPVTAQDSALARAGRAGGASTPTAPRPRPAAAPPPPPPPVEEEEEDDDAPAVLGEPVQSGSGSPPATPP